MQGAIAAILLTWRAAWWTRRGVIPVADWEERSLQISAPGAYLAVGGIAPGDDVRLVVLTKPPPADHGVSETFSEALTQDGTVKGLEKPLLARQVLSLSGNSACGQLTIDE
jgi:hypothetical protein